jgi:hypothetical protein
MKAPLLFPKAIGVCTALMAPLYVLVGATGYWSRGNSVTDIVIFSLGESLQARVAAGLILIQVGAGEHFQLQIRDVWKSFLQAAQAYEGASVQLVCSGSAPCARCLAPGVLVFERACRCMRMHTLTRSHSF